MKNNENKLSHDTKGELSGVLVVVEHVGAEVSPSSLQLTGKGRELADQINKKLMTVLIGENEESLNKMTADLISHGADIVYISQHKELAEYTTLPYVRVVADLIKDIKPEIVLFSASTSGRDMAPRIAARIQTGLTADCTNLVIDDFDDPISKNKYQKVLFQIRPAFGGDVMATIVSPDHYPQMATVRRNVFEVPPEDKSRKGEIIKFESNITGPDLCLSIEEIIRQTKKTVDLKKARIIVSGGRGLYKQSEKGFKLIKELADLLGGEVGASRGAVDSGWIDHGHQVGQTGQTVKPEVYIACGISGAVQHIAGMSGAKMIIAINKDSNASIFRYADYGLTEDVFEVLPKMIEYLKKEKNIEN
ncbi:MAG: electron transfer flavoprotein subunit alpha/FixB family protein [Candidatus Eremiobacteraeota bacterium]|nr:electron transfer flavoprotein subunit alpha/FixB family protein [Candidatus Eremiobacteraeota bacterium]